MTDHETRLRKMDPYNIGVSQATDDVAAVQWALSELDRLRAQNSQYQADYRNIQEYASKLEQSLIDKEASCDRLKRDLHDQLDVATMLADERDRLQSALNASESFVQMDALARILGCATEWQALRMAADQYTHSLDVARQEQDELAKKVLALQATESIHEADRAWLRQELTSKVKEWCESHEMVKSLSEKLATASGHLSLVAQCQPGRFWTKELPQVSGPYWWRNNSSTSPVVVDVDEYGTVLRVDRLGYSFVSAYKGDWCKIEPPQGEAVEPVGEVVKIMGPRGPVEVEVAS